MGKQENNTKHEERTQKNGAFAFFTISILMITSYLSIVCESSFAPLENNPFLGAPFEAIDRRGAKNATLILRDKQYWRLLTSIFLTHGLIDLLFSVAILCTLGRFLERCFGTKRWLLIYIGSGVAANLYSTFIPPSIVSVGNGGCILGLVGAFSVESSSDPTDGEIDELLADEEDPTENFMICDENLLNKMPYITTFCFGLVVGLVLIQFLCFYLVGSIDVKHDWPNLCGGLVMGIVLGSAIHSRERIDID